MCTHTKAQTALNSKPKHVKLTHRIAAEEPL